MTRRIGPAGMAGVSAGCVCDVVRLLVGPGSCGTSGPVAAARTSALADSR